MVGWPFEGAVPAAVVIAAVAIAFAILFIMLMIVGDDIVQCEAIVTGNEVDAFFGFALSMGVDLGPAEQTVGHALDGAIRAPEEVANIVAESIIPLFPAISDEAADLIKSCRVPCLRNHFGAR